MELSNELKSFIKENSEWVEKYLKTNNFEGIYKLMLEKFDHKTTLKAFGNLVGEFTDFMFSLDVNPLKYLTNIPSSYFYNSKLDKVTIPENIFWIHATAFEESNISYIEFAPGINLRYIGYGAFANCEKLKEIHIPHGVESIGQDAFENCINLESITIPVSATSISWSAFSGCNNLKTLIYEGNSQEYKWNLKSVKLPDGCKVICRG